MPQPHEQKLQEVVNSLTFASFNSFDAAFRAGTSRRPPSASPAAAADGGFQPVPASEG
jgi:hypothetical protein